MKTYLFKNQFVKKNIEDVEYLITQAERRYRTGSSEFSYSTLGISKEQLAKIKEEWPVDAVSRLSEIAKAIGENDDKERRALDIVHAAMTKDLVPKEDRTGKMASASLAFALMRGVAPELESGQIIEAGGKKFSLKPTQRPGRLVVDCDKVDNADAYIFALFDANLRRSWLLGWATSEEMRSSEYGNRITMPETCRWRTMSFFRPMSELRPMSDLMRKMGVTKVRDGILFESVPDSSDLPVVPPGQNLDSLLDNSKTVADDEFYKILGIEDPTEPEPNPAKQDDPIDKYMDPAKDEWEF
jgi:hypothetical protein